jgi:hypothetical protein
MGWRRCKGDGSVDVVAAWRDDGGDGAPSLDGNYFQYFLTSKIILGFVRAASRSHSYGRRLF